MGALVEAIQECHASMLRQLSALVAGHSDVLLRNMAATRQTPQEAQPLSTGKQELQESLMAPQFQPSSIRIPLTPPPGPAMSQVMASHLDDTPDRQPPLP